MKNIDISILNDIILSVLFVTPDTIERINMGVMNFNYRFNIGLSSYILRVSPFGRASYLNIEFAIMKELHQKNCKVPEPLMVSEAFGHSYMIYKPLEGNPLSSLDFSKGVTNSLAHSIVANINCMSSLDEKIFERKDLAQIYLKDWEGFLLQTIDEGKSYLSNKIFFKEFEINKIYKLLIKKISNFREIKLRLVWSDFSQDNIIVNQDGTLSGFVDFEGCLFGDALLALGYLFAVEGDSIFFKEIKKEYKKYYQFEDDSIYFYSIFRIFRIAKYLNNPLPTGIARMPLDEYFKGCKLAMSLIN